MRYEWTDGKRALALEDGSLYERGLIAEEAGQEEWLGADVTRAQSAVFRELLRLAEEHIASGNVIRSQQETVARLAERVRELGASYEELRVERNALAERCTAYAEQVDALKADVEDW